MGDLTENFSRYEFECRGEDCCGHSAPISLDLVELLQGIRYDIGRPIFINSGFRCVTYNATIPGSSQRSRHPLGLAADITLDRPDIGKAERNEWLQLLELVRESSDINGIGLGVDLDDPYLHIDIDPARHGRIEWTY